MGQLEFDFDIKVTKADVKSKIRFTKKKKVYDKRKIIDTIEKRLATAQKKHDNISTEVSGNYTPKRGREAESRRRDKDTLNSKIVALTRIRDEWKNDTIPELLREIRSINDIDTILDWGYPPELDGTEYDHYLERWNKQVKSCKRLGVTRENNEEIRELLKPYREVMISVEEIAKRQLDEKVNALRGLKIPGFFPTPPALIDRMIEHAMVEDGMTILEPSAGIGSIVDVLADPDNGFEDLKFDCVEIRPALCEILTMKGYNNSCEDILETTEVTGDLWDRIIMNPPFEKGQDIQHIKHCFETFLKPGGRLVSVASAGVAFNTQKKFKEFRDYLEEGRGYIIELEGGEFQGKEAFNQTGVKTILVIMQK